MSRLPSLFSRPQTRVVPEGVEGFATKPVTATPLIVAVAEPGDQRYVRGQGVDDVGIKGGGGRPLLLVIVTLYSITSPTVAGSVAGLPAGETKLTVLAAVRSGSVTVMLAVVFRAAGQLRAIDAVCPVVGVRRAVVEGHAALVGGAVQQLHGDRDLRLAIGRDIDAGDRVFNG